MSKLLRSDKGQVRMIAIVGGALLLVGYLVYPDPVHDFFRFLINTVLESARDAFGTSDDGGAKDRGQIRIGGKQ